MFIYNEQQNLYTSSLLNDDFYMYGFGDKYFVNEDNDLADQIHKQFPKIKHIVIPHQVHGDTIKLISKSSPKGNQIINDTDGLVTTLSDRLILVKTADCVPIFYVDTIKKIIGVSHQGYKGTLKKVPTKMIEKFIRLGSDVKNIKVIIGPSIGKCCYNIDEEREKLFKEIFPFGFLIFISKWRDMERNALTDGMNGDIFLDLKQINKQMLVEMGVIKKNIDVSPICTRCNEKFFSYRRDQTTKRMISFIVIK